MIVVRGSRIDATKLAPCAVVPLTVSCLLPIHVCKYQADTCDRAAHLSMHHPCLYQVLVPRARLAVRPTTVRLDSVLCAMAGHAPWCHRATIRVAGGRGNVRLANSHARCHRPLCPEKPRIPNPRTQLATLPVPGRGKGRSDAPVGPLIPTSMHALVSGYCRAPAAACEDGCMSTVGSMQHALCKALSHERCSATSAAVAS